MFSLLCVHQSDGATSVRMFTREHHITGDFLHCEVSYVAERATTGRAARQLGPATRTHEVPALALQYGGQDIVETHGALE